MTLHREKLTQALHQIGIEPGRDIVDQLASAYGESHRHYHNQNHISECLAALQKYKHLAERPAEIEIAIWFHDAIYDTHKGDNEEMSAKWAKQYLLDAGADETTVDRIEEMILATQSHVAKSVDAQLMLDIDLGILGQSTQVFEAYDLAIRKEYAWVPEAQYRTGRAAVLQGFLARSRIYGTEEFRSAYECKARRNLERKLNELTQ